MKSVSYSSLPRFEKCLSSHALKWVCILHFSWCFLTSANLLLSLLTWGGNCLCIVFTSQGFLGLYLSCILILQIMGLLSSFFLSSLHNAEDFMSTDTLFSISIRCFWYFIHLTYQPHFPSFSSSFSPQLNPHPLLQKNKASRGESTKPGSWSWGRIKPFCSWWSSTFH